MNDNSTSYDQVNESLNGNTEIDDDNNTETGKDRQGDDHDTYDQKHAKFKDVSFDSIMDTDRVDMVTVSEYLLSSNAFKGSSSKAICIVTVKNIHKDSCEPEKGKKVPITVRIDTIIDSSSAFSLKTGDTITLGESSVWTQDEKGYTVSYRDGIIPITEEGSQYILLISEVDERIAETYWPGLKYKAKALTIPINKNNDLSNSEIYEKMKLPDDVIQCSETFINLFFK